MADSVVPGPEKFEPGTTPWTTADSECRIPYALPPLALTLVVGAFVLPLLPLPTRPIAGSIRKRAATAGQPARRPGRRPRRARAPESTLGMRVGRSRPRPRGRRRGSARTPPG